MKLTVKEDEKGNYCLHMENSDGSYESLPNQTEVIITQLPFDHLKLQVEFIVDGKSVKLEGFKS